eukprot:146871-Alexandrium_andersonii.AAC.1
MCIRDSSKHKVLAPCPRAWAPRPACELRLRATRAKRCSRTMPPGMEASPADAEHPQSPGELLCGKEISGETAWGEL